MNNLQIFNYENAEIRVTLINNEPWWVAKDVCDLLNITWSGAKTIDRISERHKGVVKFTTPSGTQEIWCIDEPGLYKLILRSNKPGAEEFQDWVTDEVLPSIRRTGYYSLPAHATVFQALTAALGEKQALELKAINETSNQVLIGFAFHDDNFVTLEECSKMTGIPVGWFFWELQDKGYVLHILVRKGTYGVPYQREIYRLTDKGLIVGEEILNHRKTNKKKNPEPFSFRFKKAFMYKILREFEISLKSAATAKWWADLRKAYQQ